MNDTGTLQLPPQASTVASGVDDLYYFIFWGCLIFFLIIVSLCAFFVVKYRRKEGEAYRPSPTHNTPLEITWSIIPLVLLMIVFVWGFNGYMTLHVMPGHALEYYVTGAQWQWRITNPAGQTAINEMYVPVNRPIKLIMDSMDVIHSFYVPDFRVKMDVYPNQYTTLWFEATKLGDYDIFCTEYCGDEHSAMRGKVHVLSPIDYESYMETQEGQGDRTPEEYGKELYTKLVCNTCHSLDGTAKTGPSWQGRWGTRRPLADGTMVDVDENYVRESILDPTVKVVQGFSPVMPTYTGLVNDEQINALISFIKAQQ